MNLNRRGFFRAAVAAPIAMRQAASAQNAAGLGYGGLCPPSGGSSPGGPDAYSQSHEHIMKLVRDGSPPDWKLREMRRQAKYRARFLDADLLNMRSVSDANKYVIQEDREMIHVRQEMIDQEESSKGFQAIYDSIKKKLGLGF